MKANQDATTENKDQLPGKKEDKKAKGTKRTSKSGVSEGGEYDEGSGLNGNVLEIWKDYLDLNFMDMSYLTRLIKSTKGELAKIVIEQNADVNILETTTGQSALMYSIENIDLGDHQMQIVEDLVKAGANVDIWDFNGKWSSVRILLKMFNEVEKMNQTFEMLLSNGYDLSISDSEKGGICPHWAIEFLPDEECVKLFQTLERYDIDFNRSQKENLWTPLHLALHLRKYETVRKLISLGVNLNFLDEGRIRKKWIIEFNLNL